jgi:hypothetical protein
LWFAKTESSFTAKKIEAQFDRYCHVVTALPHESLRLVADLVESPPTDTPYDDIKERLVASHQISDFQKAGEVVPDASSWRPEAVGDDGLRAKRRRTCSPPFSSSVYPERS